MRSDDKFGSGTIVENNMSLRKPDGDIEEATGYSMDMKYQVAGLVLK